MRTITITATDVWSGNSQICVLRRGAVCSRTSGVAWMTFAKPDCMLVRLESPDIRHLVTWSFGLLGEPMKETKCGFEARIGHNHNQSQLAQSMCYLVCAWPCNPVVLVVVLLVAHVAHVVCRPCSSPRPRSWSAGHRPLLVVWWSCSVFTPHIF